MLAWRNGDRRAGGELIERHYRSVYRFFATKAGDEDTTEELVQRTFVGATTGIVRFEELSNARTWLLAIARNILLQWFQELARKRKREVQPDNTSLADLGTGLNTGLELHHERKRLLMALRRIPLESQIVLELSYWEQLKAREIAEVLGCPEGTARSRLRRAKAELRATLDEMVRTKEELEATLLGLETWAAQIRAATDREPR